MKTVFEIAKECGNVIRRYSNGSTPTRDEIIFYDEGEILHFAAELTNQKDVKIERLRNLLASALTQVPIGAFSNDRIKIFQEALANKSDRMASQGEVRWANPNFEARNMTYSNDTQMLDYLCNNPSKFGLTPEYSLTITRDAHGIITNPSVKEFTDFRAKITSVKASQGEVK